MTEPVPTDVERVWALLQNARGAARRLTSILIANAHRLDVPFTNDPRTPWDTQVSPAINALRAALGMRGAWPTGCACDLHGRNCEPPSELCCDQCSEIQHPGHVDGSVCSAPDLGGTAMPTRVEVDLRAEIDRLRAEVSRLTSALSTAERQRDSLARRCAVRYEETEAQRTRAERAEAELERTREVVEAAKAWRKSMQPVIANGQLPGTRPQTRALVAAVDALRTDKEGADD